MKRLTICMVVIAMLLTIGAVTAQEEAPAERWTDRLDFGGYFQFRYLDRSAPNQPNQFEFRRMFLTMRAQMDERTTGIICLSRIGGEGSNIDLFFAFVDYRLSPEWAVIAGQGPTWFGLEAWEGSSVRLPLERAKILEGGRGSNLGFFWQGPADRGVWVRRAPQAPYEPLMVLGIVNGQFREGDLNDDVLVELNAKWRQDWGQFGASWMDGNFVDGAGVTTDRSAVSLYARKFADPWGAQFEWVDGNLLGASRDGWYLQGVYDLQDDKNVAYARWEEYSAREGVNRADYDAWTVGVQHRVYDSGYITLQYTNGDWRRTGMIDGLDASHTENVLGLQWQYEFR